MAYDSMKKPASTVVPVQKKATVSAPPGMMGQSVETSGPSGQEQTLSNQPATEDDWLMKSGLFTGQHLLQRLSSPVSESSERVLATGLGQVEQREDETVKGTETAIPHSLLPTPYSPLPTPHSLPLQAKLTIGEPGDKYEQEADQVASQVVKQINSPEAATSSQGQSVQRMEVAEEELQRQPSISDLQRTPLPLEVQREAMPEGEELQAKSILQRREAIAVGDASTDLESAINSARGGGQPLDAGLQRSMGQAMGADFSGVRVHTDAQSDQLNQSIQAKAFTTGKDVFFRQGAYEPGSGGGKELIAHELTHVVQQNGGELLRRKHQMIAKEKKCEDVIQRKIENETIKDVYYEAVAKRFFKAYDDAVKKAHRYVVSEPSLGPYKNLDGHTKLWVKKWTSHLSATVVKTLYATFGYVIESLVSDGRSEFKPGTEAGIGVLTQYSVGGTRPDIVIYEKTTGKTIAWIDLTASSSRDHIYKKESWEKKVKNFAEVTYPSLTNATLMIMRKNQGSNGTKTISKKEFDKRNKAATKEFMKNKERWKKLGEQYKPSKEVKEKIGKELWKLDEGVGREYIRKKLKMDFGVANIEEKIVPSILKAMDVEAVQWGYRAGYTESVAAGEAWLKQNLPPK
jgi:hypothetical protein